MLFNKGKLFSYMFLAKNIFHPWLELATLEKHSRRKKNKIVKHIQIMGSRSFQRQNVFLIYADIILFSFSKTSILGMSIIFQ